MDPYEKVTFEEKIARGCESDVLVGLVLLDESTFNCSFASSPIRTCFRIGWKLSEHRGYDRFFSLCGSSNSSLNGLCVEVSDLLLCAKSFMENLGAKDRQIAPNWNEENKMLELEVIPPVDTTFQEVENEYLLRDCFGDESAIGIMFGIVIGTIFGLCVVLAIFNQCVLSMWGTKEDKVRGVIGIGKGGFR